MQTNPLSLTPHLDPFHPYELQCVRLLVARALRSLVTGNRIVLDYSAVEWLRERLPIITAGLDVADAIDELQPGKLHLAPSSGILRLLTLLGREDPGLGLSPHQERIDRIVRLFELGEAERAILGVAVRCSGFGHLSGLGTFIKSPRTDFPLGAKDCLGLLTGLPQATLDPLLASDANLVAHGLIADDPDCEPGSMLMTALQSEIFDEQALLDVFVERPSSELEWLDFAHLEADLARLENILASARDHSMEGVNILFHGLPGTGKTELAKLVAQRLSMPVVMLDGVQGRGRRHCRDDVLTLFRVRKRIASLVPGSVLVVDEADDLLSGLDSPDPAARPASKLHINRNVEQGGRPTIWITNHPERLGISVLRRMTFAIDFQVPDRAARSRILERIFERHAIRSTREQRLELAAHFALPPALFESAAKAAAAVGGDLSLFKASVLSISKILGGEKPVRAPAMTRFCLNYINTDDNIDEVVSSLRLNPGRNVSMLLSGPPGTGKTAFAHHLAQELGLDLTEIRPSDLMSKWHGETERNIADLFRHADGNGALLLFDEVDSFLCSRTRRAHSWEISQVNEFLSWLDSTTRPVIATTNDPSLIDPAALRRFMFKMEFKPMTVGQARAAFLDVFGLPLAPDIVLPEGLCMGDLVIVKRQSAYRPIRHAGEIVARLKEELRHKGNICTVDDDNRKQSQLRH